MRSRSRGLLVVKSGALPAVCAWSSSVSARYGMLAGGAGVLLRLGGMLVRPCAAEARARGRFRALGQTFKSACSRCAPTTLRERRAQRSRSPSAADEESQISALSDRCDDDEISWQAIERDGRRPAGRVEGRRGVPPGLGRARRGRRAGRVGARDRKACSSRGAWAVGLVRSAARDPRLRDVVFPLIRRPSQRRDRPRLVRVLGRPAVVKRRSPADARRVRPRSTERPDQRPPPTSTERRSSPRTPARMTAAPLSRAARRAGPWCRKRPRAAVDAPTTRGGGPPWMPVSWTAAWPLPRASSQRLTGTVSTNATASANERLPQKRTFVRPASIAPGIASMIALSTTSITAMLTRVGGERDRDHRAERRARPQQRDARQHVAEEERERDRERDRAPFGEPERGAEDHPEHLADRTAGEAVQGGADRERGERGALARRLVLIVARGPRGRLRERAQSRRGRRAVRLPIERRTFMDTAYPAPGGIDPRQSRQCSSSESATSRPSASSSRTSVEPAVVDRGRGAGAAVAAARSRRRSSGSFAPGRRSPARAGSAPSATPS